MDSQPDDKANQQPARWRVWLRPFLSIVVILGAIVGLGLQPVLQSLAAPVQPGGFEGRPGNEGEVILTWDTPPSEITGYKVEQRDLATLELSTQSISSTTSFTVGSLKTGHWYRFRLIPLNGTTEGLPSHFIDVRTKGFSGSYQSYYALGDSFASGEGAPPYAGIASCYRSQNSYVYLLGEEVPTPTMIACSGASIDNIDTTTQNSQHPGTQLQQLQAGSLANTLITISIGGNDIGFASALQACIVDPDPCTTNQETLSQKITDLAPRLHQLYQNIRAVAPAADILVIGYPLLVADPELANCHNGIARAGLNEGELTMIRDLSSLFDTILNTSATFSGMSYVSGVDAFAGHEACTPEQSDAWINEITSLSEDLHGSFHPNQAGYQAYADAVNTVRTSLYQSGGVRPDLTLTPIQRVDCGNRTDVFQIWTDNEANQVCFANPGTISVQMYNANKVCTGDRTGNIVWHNDDLDYHVKLIFPDKNACYLINDGQTVDQVLFITID